MSMRTRILAALLAAGALTTALPAAAQTAGGLHAGSLEVPVNKSQVVTADRSIAKALVGNPSVADVLPISERSVYVLGKSFGTTSLTLYDRMNRVIAVMDVQVGPDVEGIRSQLSQLIPGQQIEARLSNGSVVLTGLASNVGAASNGGVMCPVPWLSSCCSASADIAGEAGQRRRSVRRPRASICWPGMSCESWLRMPSTSGPTCTSITAITRFMRSYRVRLVVPKDLPRTLTSVPTAARRRRWGCRPAPWRCCGRR